MNIALILLHADATRGGAEGYTVSLARWLLDRRHHVSFIAQTFGEHLPRATHVPIKNAGLTRLARYHSFLRHIDQHLDQHPYDIVHAMLPIHRCDFYHPHAGLALQGVETGYLRHTSPLHQLASRIGTHFNRKRHAFTAVERQLLSSSAPNSKTPIVLCPTESMRQLTLRRFPIDPASVVTLRFGIDLDQFDPTARAPSRAQIRAQFNLSDDRVVALMIAQDFQRKGLPEAIAAIAAANDPRLALLVVGRDDPAPFKRQAEKLNIPDRILFAGPTPDVPAYCAASDLLLFPSRVEPFGLVVLEALAMGLPTIVTRRAGAHELITHNHTGFVIEDPSDIPAMSSALRQLLNPATLQQMRTHCLTLRPTLSYQSHLDALINLYHSRLSAPHEKALPSKP